jgi:hypothetical protein
MSDHTDQPRYKRKGTRTSSLSLAVGGREKEKREAERGYFQSDERTLYRLKREHFVWLCLKRCLAQYFSNMHYAKYPFKYHDTVPTKLLGTPPFFQCILMALRVLEKIQ